MSIVIPDQLHVDAVARYLSTSRSMLQRQFQSPHVSTLTRTFVTSTEMQQGYFERQDQLFKALMATTLSPYNEAAVLWLCAP